MAEEALYGNVCEPKFPFELVAKKLGSLTEDIESANRSGSYNDFPSMLNTILVWARARTATWWTNDVYGINETLVSSLNAILEDVGANATYHRLELVPRFNMFFVTCRNSPRFNWSTQPTHLEIGQNLDFSLQAMFSKTRAPPVADFVYSILNVPPGDRSLLKKFLSTCCMQTRRVSND